MTRSDGAHVHDASEMSSGTLVIARLPCSTGQVAQKTDSGWACATPLSAASQQVADPGAPCDAIKQAAPSSADGVYWLRTGTSAAFQGWCEEKTGFRKMWGGAVS